MAGGQVLKGERGRRDAADAWGGSLGFDARCSLSWIDGWLGLPKRRQALQPLSPRRQLVSRAMILLQHLRCCNYYLLQLVAACTSAAAFQLLSDGDCCCCGLLRYSQSTGSHISQPAGAALPPHLLLRAPTTLSPRLASLIPQRRPRLSKAAWRPHGSSQFLT